MTVEATLKHAELLRPTEDIDLASAMAFSFGKPKYMQAEAMSQKEKLMHEKRAWAFIFLPIQLHRKDSSGRISIVPVES